MTRMTGPDCAVMCNLMNTHTHIHTTVMRAGVEARQLTQDGSGERGRGGNGNGDGGERRNARRERGDGSEDGNEGSSGDRNGERSANGIGDGKKGTRIETKGGGGGELWYPLH